LGPALVLVSIPPIFYGQLFRTKVFCVTFTCLQFEFVIFWQKDFGTKAAHEMLVKLTPGNRAGERMEGKLQKKFYNFGS
jgi:hypothetical protein